ncbi:MAG: hypothetical protein QM804_16410 [Propionicimonas sp.]
MDEVHRFSKTQQDVLLPAVENRLVTLIAATTENPSFSVISPLLSRSLLLTLKPLTEDDIGTLIDRALTDERGLNGEYTLDAEARDTLLRLAGGDARRALTYLEEAAAGARAHQVASDRHRDHLGRGRPGRRPLRPGRRPALRRDQRLHQERPRLRRAGRAALPGAG